MNPFNIQNVLNTLEDVFNLMLKEIPFLIYIGLEPTFLSSGLATHWPTKVHKVAAISVLVGTL